jgi:hypothetical protein
MILPIFFLITNMNAEPFKQISCFDQMKAKMLRKSLLKNFLRGRFIDCKDFRRELGN